jgi:predicted nucleic acid-binding protein
MQSIVADTTPLNYLVLIQAADILPELYRTVLIPPAVKAELAHANTPAVVRAWISQPPAWLEVVSLKQPIDSALEHLDAGEREAISLASELQAILLLMDERDGVTIARHGGLKVVGTLAALDLAPAHGLVANHVRPVARDHVPVTGSPHGEHARAGCRAQEASRRPTIAERVDKARSGYNQGTIRSDIRYLVVSKDVRRHRLTVTAEVASSSLVVPAILSKHVQMTQKKIWVRLGPISRQNAPSAAHSLEGILGCALQHQLLNEC